MASRGQSSSCGEEDFEIINRSDRISPTSAVESLAKLQSENKSFRQLIQILNTRHTECLFYIQILKTMNGKLMKRLNETDNTLNNLEEINCENNLIKLDKQIDSLHQQLFSSSNKTSVQTQTTGEPIERTILKWNSSKSGDNNTVSHSSGKFRCEFFGCNQFFVRKEQMESHLRLHNSMQEAINFEQTFNDNFDDKTKNNNKTLNESIIFVPQMELEVIEFSNNSDNNNNPMDSLTFANSASDDSNSQNRTERSQIRCDICGKTFSKHYIQSHRRSHTGVKPYKCSYAGCERTFTQTSSRNYHEKTYHRSDKYSFKCYFNNCQKSFGRQIDLQKHLNLHTSAGNPLAIQFNAGTLLQPVPIDHQLIKVIKTRKLRRVPHRSGKHGCPQCGKTFAHKVALRQHEVIHGSKQFVCTFNDCKYASYWKQNLSLHLRRHHNQE